MRVGIACGKPIPLGDVTSTTATGTTDNKIDTSTMAAGRVATGRITLSGFSSSATVETMIQTTTGNQYPKAIVPAQVTPSHIEAWFP